MKKFLLASTAALIGTATMADEIKIGVVLGFTGPIESLTPAIAGGAEAAIAEVSESGKFLDGMTVSSVRADSTCVDASAATSVAERVITGDGVKGIVGAACSGVTGAILANVAMPNGMVMISPSATSPALSQAEDNGLFFRTAPSDARQSEVMSDILRENGAESIAITYTNNDYGKGLADSLKASFEEDGGTVTIVAAHEDGKADYSAEVGALASAGGDVLVVAGYVDQGGSGIVRAALDQGAFDTFHFPDGMLSDTLTENFGDEIEGSRGQNGAAKGDGAEMFATLVSDAFDPTSPYGGEGYDAAALILLAMQKAGSVEPGDYKSAIMDVANEPGEVIMPGELTKALELLAAGQDINYEGVTAIEMLEPGESAGSFREIVIEGGQIVPVGFR